MTVTRTFGDPGPVVVVAVSLSRVRGVNGIGPRLSPALPFTPTGCWQVDGVKAGKVPLVGRTSGSVVGVAHVEPEPPAVAAARPTAPANTAATKNAASRLLM